MRPQPGWLNVHAHSCWCIHMWGTLKLVLVLKAQKGGQPLPAERGASAFWGQRDPGATPKVVGRADGVSGRASWRRECPREGR